VCCDDDYDVDDDNVLDYHFDDHNDDDDNVVDYHFDDHNDDSDNSNNMNINH